ncbi:MAG: type II toxin-antitoxin system RelE/ParE family toxin [Verrucomicrobia bacterium]|nr:type II toxin-antitoxin system RelE/ParE family toxin [Verrucomicrobiota bacterium]
MSWRVVVRPEVWDDVDEATRWYDARADGLGNEFVEEVIRVLDALADNPLLNSRRHPRKNIRWRYPERFPYRVIFEVSEDDGVVIVGAVLHAARHDRHWQGRF